MNYNNIRVKIMENKREWHQPKVLKTDWIEFRDIAKELGYKQYALFALMIKCFKEQLDKDK